MPKAFNIVLIQPPGYVHAMAFHETALLLQYSLQSLGFPVDYQINEMRNDATNIVLGYQILNDASQIPECDFIIYQLEQLSDREGWFRPELLEFFRRASSVWDYSAENIAFLAERGVENTKHLPLGFHDRLQVVPLREPDIDVLFYGCINERRKLILDELAKDYSVHVLFGCYGPERDEFIARSKVVLNIHFYEAQIMEQPRLSYLLNNRRFVLSEASSVNPYQGFFPIASYEDLIESCRYWIEHPIEREQAAQSGYEAFRRCPMIENIRRIVE